MESMGQMDHKHTRPVILDALEILFNFRMIVFLRIMHRRFPLIIIDSHCRFVLLNQFANNFKIALCRCAMQNGATGKFAGIIWICAVFHQTNGRLEKFGLSTAHKINAI